MMFRTCKCGSREFFETAIEEWCKKNRVNKMSVLSDVSHLTAEDKQMVCDIFNNEKSIVTVQSIIDYIEEVRRLVAEGAHDIYMIAVPEGNIYPTFGYMK